MPSMSVYRVLFSRSARMAASLMFSGVLKSGSPWLSTMISLPSAASARALAEIPMVWDICIRFKLSEKKPMARGLSVGFSG